MKNFTVNGVSVQLFKEGNSYYGGFIFGFCDKRNYCGYFGTSLSKAFTRIRKTCYVTDTNLF